MYIGAGTAAFLIVASSVAMAPSHKRVVAISTYLIGAVAAAYVGISWGNQEGFLSMTSALLIGALTTIWLIRNHDLAAAA
jgi:hypothetical protein